MQNLVVKDGIWKNGSTSNIHQVYITRVEHNANDGNVSEPTYGSFSTIIYFE